VLGARDSSRAVLSTRRKIAPTWSGAPPAMTPYWLGVFLRFFS